MRHLHSESHFRHALFALQDADGYVEALLGMAREQVAGRRSGGLDRLGGKAKPARIGGRKAQRR